MAKYIEKYKLYKKQLKKIKVVEFKKQQFILVLSVRPWMTFFQLQFFEIELVF